MTIAYLSEVQVVVVTIIPKKKGNAAVVFFLQYSTVRNMAHASLLDADHDYHEAFGCLACV